MIVTIDGPVASGKTSVARAVAAELSWFCLLSGYLYRGVTYGLQYHLSYNEDQLKNPREKDITAIIAMLQYEYINNSVTVTLHHDNITALLKSPTIDQMVSYISKVPFVRQQLVVLQRHLLQLHENALAEGRDCGTTVFPQADLKIFLTADAQVRAARWQHDQAKNGINLPIGECLKSITDRDMQDTHRACSPLTVAAHAVVIDSSNKTFAETVQTVVSMIKVNRSYHNN